MAELPQVLHYIGCDDDRGGIISVVRNLAGAGEFGVLLGVNPGCIQHRGPPLPALELPRVAGEKISPGNFWRARAVARRVQAWLRADAARIFHGHSRAGLLVGWWLHRWGERRVVVSLHCYGRQRWFYRWAARQLGDRLFWLSPAMKEYYGAGGAGWAQCVPGCVPEVSGRTARGATSGDFIRLGGIGQLAPWKNWELVLAALARLPAATRARFRFRHIGAGDGSADAARYEAELRTRSDSEELRGVIEWCGPQPSAEAFIAETDCLVVASQNEPFSIAMLEALAAGVPVLAADSGGARDVIVPGHNGWLYRSSDAAALAEKIAALAGGDLLARTPVDAASLQRFRAPVVARQWREIYARVSAA